MTGSEQVGLRTSMPIEEGRIYFETFQCSVQKTERIEQQGRADSALRQSGTQKFQNKQPKLRSRQKLQKQTFSKKCQWQFCGLQYRRDCHKEQSLKQTRFRGEPKQNQKYFKHNTKVLFFAKQVKTISQSFLGFNMLNYQVRIVFTDDCIAKVVSLVAALGLIKNQGLAVDGLLEQKKLDGNKEGCEDPIGSHQCEESPLIFVFAADQPQALSKGDRMIIAIVANLRLCNIGDCYQRLFHLTITKITMQVFQLNLLQIQYFNLIYLFSLSQNNPSNLLIIVYLNYYNTNYLMIRLGTARFARSNSWLQWEKRMNGAFIRFPDDNQSLHTLYFIHSNILFKHMIESMNLDQRSVSYPEGIDSQSPVLAFLLNNNKPLAIEFNLKNGQKKFLRNQACDNEAKYIKQIIEDPTSIYGHLRTYLAHTDKQNKDYSSKMNYYLNHFYLRMTARTFCKKRGLKANVPMNENLKQQILNYIGQEYQNSSPASIKMIYVERALIMGKIQQTKAQIQRIEEQCDKKLQFYKIGAIFVTAAHIISFGYMIFFVDWLGWDIIEPLTYSVGVAYTLLGIRFYRKYRIDRTGDSIRQILMKIVINPKKLVELKDLKFRLQLQNKQLRRIETRSRILKNHINFRTSLATAFNQRTIHIQ